MEASYIKQILTDRNEDIDNNPIIGDINTNLHQWIYHPDRNISKETLDLKDV